MKNALKELLNALDKLLADGHEEISDTVVREALHGVVFRALVQRDANEELPSEFGMFTPGGNKRLRVVLSKFLDHPEVAKAKKLPTRQARLSAFQDDEVESDEGNSYDDYFGYNDGSVVPSRLPAAIPKPVKPKRR